MKRHICILIVLTFSIINIYGLFNNYIAIAQDAQSNQPSVLLYQPSEILEKRVPDVNILASFIKDINFKSDAFFKIINDNNYKSAIIVVAIKPQHKAKYWIEFPSINNSYKNTLNSELLKIIVPEIHDGPVAFALLVGKRHNKLNLKLSNDQIYLPNEWKISIPSKSAIIVPDDILKVIWNK